MNRIPFEELGDVPEDLEARSVLVARLRLRYGWEDQTDEEVLAAYVQGRVKVAARLEVLEARAAKRMAKVKRWADRAAKREKRERERRRRPVHRR